MTDADIGSIPTRAKWFKENGYPFSEYTLRKLVKSGAIRARYVGPKPLVSRNEILRYFQCLDGCDNAPSTLATGSGIRRVEL